MLLPSAAKAVFLSSRLAGLKTCPAMKYKRSTHLCIIKLQQLEIASAAVPTISTLANRWSPEFQYRRRPAAKWQTECHSAAGRDVRGCAPSRAPHNRLDQR